METEALRDPNTTQRCENCRYWSELVSRMFGIELQAVCLAPAGAPMAQQYTAEHQHCSAWGDGFDGAIDAPGLDPTRYGKNQA
jgi:hypothetical protein